MCDAFVWGAVGGVSDALEAFFARTVFGGYEGGAAWGGAWLEHEGGVFLCVRIYGVRYGACVIAALAFVCAALLWVALLYVGALHGVWAWGAKGIRKGGGFGCRPLLLSLFCLYIYTCRFVPCYHVAVLSPTRRT